MEDMVLFGERQKNMLFLKRQKNMRTCCWGKTREHENMLLFEKTEGHENMLFLKRQKNRRTGFLKTEEWVSVGGYGIPAIPTQT